MSSETVDAMISEGLAAITNDDGSLKELPADEPEDYVDNGIEPARLVEPEMDGQVDELEGGEPELDAATEEPAEATKGPKDDGPAYGSEEDPFEAADVPDEFFKTKDGEVVSLKKAVEGYQKQVFVDRQIHRVKQLAEEAESARKQTAETMKRQQQGMLRTMTNPDDLDRFLSNYDPVARHDFFMKYYKEFHAEVQEAGGVEQHRLKAQLRRDARQVEARRKQLDEQGRRSETQRVVEARRAVVIPAIKAAAAAVGVELTPDIRRRIGPALDIEARALGRELTSEDVQSVTERWLRAYGNAPEKVDRRARKPRQRKAPAVVQGERRGQRTGKEPSKYDQFGNLSTDWLLSQS